MTEPGKLLKIQDVTSLLNCEKSLVYHLIASRQIPYIKLGHRTVRFDPGEIEAWIQSRHVSPRRKEKDA